MNKQQEFRKQTEEAKLEAFSLMCRKVAELEKENAKLKEKLKEELKTIADKDLSFVARFDALEKENAELKEKVNILDNCDRLGDVITEAYKDQLTKAKELLKKLLSAYTTYADSFDDRDNEIVEEAEQFLKDVGKVK